MSVLTAHVLSVLFAALLGAAKGALEHLTVTPPGGPYRYRRLAGAALTGAVLAAAAAG